SEGIIFANIIPMNSNSTIICIPLGK
ncbi:unnamed protein product, partial [Rotaria sp. Silwood1]